MTTPALDAAPRDRRDVALSIATDALRALLRDGALSAHTGHWDRTGGSGSGCPVCIQQREASAAARRALADIEELLR
jgi:hypothetical protein